MKNLIEFRGETTFSINTDFVSAVVPKFAMDGKEIGCLIYTVGDSDPFHTTELYDAVMAKLNGSTTPVVHGRWLNLEEYAEKIGADPERYTDGWSFCSECGGVYENDLWVGFLPQLRRKDGGDMMPIEMQIHILARAVDACLDAALATAPSNYRMHLEDMQEMIRELLEED